MFINPVQGKNWDMPCQRSNFHTHIGTGRNTCGHHTFEEVLPWYQDLGYGCLCLSNHDRITDLEPLRNQYDMVLIPGYEYTHYCHMVSLGSDRVVSKASDESEESAYQKAIDSCREDGGIPIVCHPNWPYEWRCTKEFLNTIHGYMGMEIVNGSVDRGPMRRPENPNGRPGASNVYDWLISKDNNLVWCFGNDDFHRWWHFSVYWNMIFADKNQDSIMDALKKGCFYVSSGLVLEYLDLSDGRLRIKARNFEGQYEDYTYKFIGKWGNVLKTVTDLEASYVIKGDEGYIRVDVTNTTGKQLYTQPVYDDQIYTLPQ